MYLKGESVWTLYELGEWDALLEVAREIDEWDRTSYQSLLALPYVAHVHLLRGELAEAASLRDEFLPRAHESGDPQVLMPALATSALIDESRGDSATAVALIEELAEATKGRPLRRAQHLPDALRICASAGATELAERLLEPIEVAAARQRHAVHAARAVQAEMLGRADEALALYAEAAERWAEFGFDLERGHALLGAGRCLLGFGHAREAAAKLAEARKVFARLQTQPLVEDADALSELAAAHIP
jgi:tetratricopeptide (TPR) repeat protein